jgi:tetratricopeptide (TPR) repeat protein
LDEALRHLVREGILEEDGLTPSHYLRFRHGLYQEAVLCTLTDRRLRDLHESIGRALEIATADQIPEQIANHYIASGNKTKAIEFLESAARRATALASVSVAVDFVAQARSMCDTADDPARAARLTAFAAELERYLGHYETASALWREVLCLATDDGAKRDAYLEIARTEFELGELEAASNACAEGLGTAGSTQAEHDLILTRAAIALRRDRFDEVRGLLEAIDATQDTIGVRTDIQRLSLWAGYHAHTGDFDAAAKCGADTLAKAEAFGEIALQLRAQRDAGLIEFARGQLLAARRCLEEVYGLAVQSGHMIRAQEAVGNLVGAHLLMGDLDEGWRLGTEAMGWVNALSWRVLLLRNVGEIEHEMDKQSARPRLLECQRLCDGVQAPRGTGAFAALRLAVIDVETGQLARALGRASAVAQEYEDAGRPDVRVEALMTLAIVALAQGEPRTAHNLMREACNLAPRADPTMKPALFRVLAQALFRTAEAGAARQVASEALALARSMGMRLEEARALLVLGEVESEGMRRHLNDAREIFAECGSQRGLAEVRKAAAALTA